MPAPADTQRPDPPSRVLLVRPSALGDVARTVPALVTLRRAWPEARIDWLVAESFVDCVRHHPLLDGVVSFARERLARFGLRPAATAEGFRFARRLHAPRYDTVVDLQGLFRSGLFSALTRARRRVGFADAREGGWLFYNVRHRVNGSVRHTVERMLALLEAEGLEPQRDMRLYLGERDRAWLADYLGAHGIPADDYVCVAPTARWGCKCWPVDRYAQIARRVLERDAVSRVVVLSAPSERKQLEPMLAALRGHIEAGRVHAPTTTVGQLMALVSGARLLLCNDSAPLHIAVGFDRPIVAVFGPTDPAAVGPYGRQDAVVLPPGGVPAVFDYRGHGDDPTLIGQVELETVWARVASVLAEPPLT